MSSVLLYFFLMARIKDKPKDDKPQRAIDKLSVKERKFVGAILEGATGAAAVRKAGYNSNTPTSQSVRGHHLLKRDNIQLAIKEGLEKAGLTEAKIFEHLAEAVSSGVGRDSRNSDALRGLDMIFKLTGSYAPKEHKVSKTTLNIDLHTKEDTEIIELLNAKSTKFDDIIDAEIED